MPVTIVGNNTPTAGGVVYGDGTNYTSTSAGSAGGVLYSAGASSPAFTTAGTSGQVLQSNGASAPSWATPAAGATVFLSSVTASNSATVDVESTFNSTYDVYMITVSGVTVVTDAVDLRMRLKIGGTYLEASYKPMTTALRSNDASTFSGTSSSGSIDWALGVGNAAGEFASATFYIFNPSSTSIFKGVIGNTVSCNSTGNAVQSTVSAFNEANTSALTGVRFYSNLGNISTGTFRLYGIKNS